MFEEVKKNDEFLSKIVIIVYRLGNYIYYDFRIPILKIVLYTLYKLIDFIFIKVLLNTEISAKVKIGQGLVIFHPFGIIINPQVVMGSNVVIRHQVTIGNTGIDDETPVIGDNVQIGVGAKIIGGIEIKSNSVIGANAVVNKNFKDSGLLAGVPATIRKRYKYGTN